MKNFIQLGDEKFTLEPKTETEAAETFGVMVTIVAAYIGRSTDSIKDDEQRVAVILKACGSFGGAVAKLIITEEALAKSVPEDKGNSNDA